MIDLGEPDDNIPKKSLVADIPGGGKTDLREPYVACLSSHDGRHCRI